VRASSRSAISSIREELSRSGERAKRETCSEQGKSLSLLLPQNLDCRFIHCQMPDALVELQGQAHKGRPEDRAAFRSASTLSGCSFDIVGASEEGNLVKRKTCSDDRMGKVVTTTSAAQKNCGQERGTCRQSVASISPESIINATRQEHIGIPYLG
jgi:hypothetical protein